MKKLLTATLAVGLLLSAGGPTHAASGSEVVNTGSKYIGTPYQYGAQLGNTRSFDCSSYTAHVFAQAGINLPRTTAGQVGVGTAVSKANLQPGDLVFFKTTSSRVGHVAIYVGNGKMIGSQSSTGVATVSINGPYWGERYVTARRVTDSAPSQAVAPKTETVKEKAPAHASAPSTSGVLVHTVVRGNTLYGLAKQYGTNVSSIKKMNELKTDTIYVGQKLSVAGNTPAKATAPTKAPAPTAAKQGSYTVKKGDTLWGISKSQGTTVHKLISANGLSTSLIHPGKTLVIPR